MVMKNVSLIVMIYSLTVGIHESVPKSHLKYHSFIIEKLGTSSPA